MTKNLNTENSEECEQAQDNSSTHEMNIVEDDPLDTTGQFFYSVTKICYTFSSHIYISQLFVCCFDLI